MAQRIAYEQKMLCGKWIEQQADFASVLQGVDFCADRNEETGAYRYRVKVIADTATAQEGTDNVSNSQHSQLVEHLKDIIKAASTPANQVNILPEMTLAFIAEQAKAALREATSRT